MDSTYTFTNTFTPTPTNTRTRYSHVEGLAGGGIRRDCRGGKGDFHNKHVETILAVVRPNIPTESTNGVPGSSRSSGSLVPLVFVTYTLEITP